MTDTFPGEKISSAQFAMLPKSLRMQTLVEIPELILHKDMVYYASFHHSIMSVSAMQLITLRIPITK